MKGRIIRVIGNSNWARLLFPGYFRISVFVTPGGSTGVRIGRYNHLNPVRAGMSKDNLDNDNAMR